MDYIDIRVSFVRDGHGEDTFFIPTRATFAGSTLPEDVLEGIAEAAFQSDYYTVGVSNAMLAVLGGGTQRVDY